VSEAFDPNDMILRFRERAEAVKRRGLPPVEGPDRLRFLEAAKIGADIATMPFGVMEKLVAHPLTDLGLARFLKDWEKVPKG